MKNDVKDVVFCHQGSHAVPRAEITKLWSDNGKVARVCCLACKEMVLEQRKLAQAAFRNQVH